MLLYDTLSASKREFEPIDRRRIGMYVCGPTVYDYNHLGHARTYLSFDLLHRYLRFKGFEVNYVQNITDVGHLVGEREAGQDKIKQKAEQTGQSLTEIIEHFSEAHKKDLRLLNILMPSEMPAASAHIKDIISFIEGLIEKRVAYQTTEGNVYFAVSKKPDYGKLSRRGLTEILTGTRVEPAKDKRSPADFALWKAAPIGTKELTWESPWSRGFPGWHIECSAMSRKYLGDTFDIHGSAVEHVFPHHENEIAQSESLTDKPLANYWVHTGLLTINGQKMSKSLRNAVTVSDALKNYSANEIRLAFFQTHYRKPFDYTSQALAQGVSLRSKIFTSYSGSLPSESDKAIWDEIISALEDDLDSPRALAIWAAEGVNKLSRQDNDKLMAIFGLNYRHLEDDETASRLAKERDEARKKGDFLTADNRKAELSSKGFEVIDNEQGSVYVPR